MFLLVAAFIANSGEVEITSMSEDFLFELRFNTFKAQLLDAFVTLIFIGCHDGLMSVTECVLFCCLDITNSFVKSAGCSTPVLATFCMFTTTFISVKE